MINKIFQIYLIIIFSIFLVSTSVLGESNTNLDTYNHYVYDQEITHSSKLIDSDLKAISDGPIRKLGRGLVNVVFGCMEIPIKVLQANEEQGGVAALTYGIFNGLLYFVAREFVGVLDIITFPVPMPGCSTKMYSSGWGYGPLMQPEWIFDYTNNPYNFVYPEYPIK